MIAAASSYIIGVTTTSSIGVTIAGPISLAEYTLAAGSGIVMGAGAVAGPFTPATGTVTGTATAATKQ